MISILFSQGRFGEVDPGFLRDWLIVAACIVGLVIAVMTMVEKLKAKQPSKVSVSPDPLQVKEVKDLATRAELESIKRDIDADLSMMRETMAAGEKRSHEETVEIHKRINVMAENTSAIKGRLEEIAQSLHHLVQRSMK